ncbi:hypothetical protein MTO96_044757, partial [Rhipicephalus appendiculatus]
SLGSLNCLAVDPSGCIGCCRLVPLALTAFLHPKDILPEGVILLFGGFAPSIGHGRDLCKILNAEFQRQARV